MGYTLSFRKEDEVSASIEYAYGYNMYRDVFDPTAHKGKSGSEMIPIFHRSIEILHAKHPIRFSSRDLLKISSGNLEILLKTLLETANKHTDWTFSVE